MVLFLYLDKRRGVQGNTRMRSREFPRVQPKGTPETECRYFPGYRYRYRYRYRYIHYTINKSDEALVIAIAIAMSRAIDLEHKRKQIKKFLGMVEL